MRRIIKGVLLVTGTIFILLALIYHDLIVYGIRQGYGQLSIIWNAKPVRYYLENPDFPDSLKTRLVLIQEIREYAIDSLGLKDTDNYKTVYDQKGKEIMWVVLAAKPYSLEPKEWRFPVLGAVPYKGFFTQKLAQKLRDELEKEGWDVIIRNPGGWSTLGWFTDPILSKMLSRSEGDLANLIIHEMSHATIFVKDSVDFNENLATFIGDRGAEKFLIDRYGKHSKEFKEYMAEDEDYVKYADHMLRGAETLDSLYQTFTENDPVSFKKNLKELTIQRIINNLDTLSLTLIQQPSKRFAQQLPNNAVFMNFRQYQAKQDDFSKEFNEYFGGNLKAYISFLSEKYPFL
jgi:predicted aminopeptidase